jgi:ATP-dependent Zn protease
VNRPPDNNQDDNLENSYVKKMKRWNVTISGSNILMIFLLFVGMILLLLFIQINLKKNMSDKKPKGQVESNQSGKAESYQNNANAIGFADLTQTNTE